MKWFSYPKVYSVGDARVEGLLKGPVVVTEKIDGSQFSFGMLEGGLVIHSHHADITNVDLPYGMFTDAIRWVRDNKEKLKVGYIYRGEVVYRPKHNILTYNRTPKNNIIIFDINADPSGYMGYSDVVYEAQRLGLETVPLFYYGTIQGAGDLKNLLSAKPSILGGSVEGCVVKNYRAYNGDGHVLMGKYVTDAFKEIKTSIMPVPGESWLDSLVRRYKTEARWSKAVIHLYEQGRLSWVAQDIPALMEETERDLKEECSAAIAKDLLDHWWREISSKVRSGLPDWYLKQLADKAFDAKMIQENPLTEITRDDMPA